MWWLLKKDRAFIPLAEVLSDDGTLFGGGIVVVVAFDIEIEFDGDRFNDDDPSKERLHNISQFSDQDLQVSRQLQCAVCKYIQLSDSATGSEEGNGALEKLDQHCND
ncbi:hypothetical protein L1987_01053 [Smallanthus sonchifolius]|uniref:Uncharacterized protein n=1 Tax=Smallanthus sonchifolius TaxID=185202 RepID=A0ACB9K414_9ASTR|nr:hypothetical protein L1987_01053 [Smallanthus sonchifolius]